MSLVTFFLFILSCIGITNLVVNATILDNPRDFIFKRSDFLKKLLTCMMCSGFWVGFFAGFFWGINPIVSGSTISLLSYIYGLWMDYFEIILAIKANFLEDS